MARRYKRSRRTIQKIYRARRSRYEQYLATSEDINKKTYKQWSKDIVEAALIRREYKIYKERFAKRLKSSTMGFYDENPLPTYKLFKEHYIQKRNDLRIDVEQGLRKTVGSVVNELINDQAYELSSSKAAAIKEYLMTEETALLVERGLAEQYFDEEGRVQYRILKPKKLDLLVRQGDFVREEIGLWDKITNVYRRLRDKGYSAEDAKREIGLTYFNSPK